MPTHSVPVYVANSSLPSRERILSSTLNVAEPRTSSNELDPSMQLKLITCHPCVCSLTSVHSGGGVGGGGGGGGGGGVGGVGEAAA